MENKRIIINRMLKYAASYLGVARVEVLDPLIVRFVEALAEEIYKLNGEIENIEGRILDKLANMLTMGKTVTAMPAHAILHASATEKESLVTKETTFCYKESKGKSAFNFHPVCNTLVYCGNVAYLIANGRVYSMDGTQEKTLFTRPRRNEEQPAHSFWIGLHLNEEIDNLKNLSFYFDFLNINHKTEYLSLLPYTVWKIGKQTLDMQQGLYSVPTTYNDPRVRLFAEYDRANTIDKNIKEKYDKHFLTITGDVVIENRKTLFPETLKPYYPAEMLDDFKQPLVWIEVQYPAAIKPDIIDALHVSINAFPVANKILRAKNADVNPVLQMVPLETNHNEYFISVHAITDSQGQEYYELPFKDNQETAYNSYSLRRGGCERADIRDVRDYMLNLSDALQMDTSSFSVSADKEDDFSKISGQINRLAAQLKRAVTDMKEQREIPSYAIFDNLQGDEILFVKYWLTNCQAANGIKQGTLFEAQAETHFTPLSIILLTTTAGGKQPPQSIDRNNLYKQVLAKNTTIVNKEDMLAFCRGHFHDTIQKAEVKTGVVASSNPKEDLVRTTDVYLWPRPELRHLFQSPHAGYYFKQQLMQHSPENFNYRIFIMDN